MKKLFLFPFILFLSTNCWSEHTIDIERYVADENFFDALVSFEKMPRRRHTLSAKKAAAEAAWGLGLAERAIQEYEEVIRSKGLKKRERAKAFLSRGIIEFQEERYRVAVVYAEKSLESFSEQDELRSYSLALWGESLMKMGAFGAAEQKLLEAQSIAPEPFLAEISYRLGRCLYRLGRFSEAGEQFLQVPLEHERTSDALRYLIRIGVEEKDWANVSFWIQKARAEYPKQFLGSWFDFALYQALIHLEDKETAASVLAAAEEKYPPSDSWLTILRAESELQLRHSRQLTKRFGDEVEEEDVIRSNDLPKAALRFDGGSR